MLMECNMRSVAEKRSKTYEDPATMVSSSFCCLRHQESGVTHKFSVQFQAPEKRAKFERTADMLAKSGLLDITMKTAELLRSNQQARQELVQLKLEIDEFTR